MSNGLPLAVVDTNFLFDYFLGRDPDVLLLAALSGKKVDILVPEFVLLEFRGSVLKELGRLQRSLQDVATIAKELERADELTKGAGSLRAGVGVADGDIETLRTKLDPFLATVRGQFKVIPHTPALHYLGDLRFVQGLPPDNPKRGVQDCRIFETVLEIARNDAGVTRPDRIFLTKDGDFLKKAGVAAELKAVGMSITDKVAPLYHRWRE